jgi:hypothetical protein
MMPRMTRLLIALCLIAIPVMVTAQLPVPNAAGVSAGHHIFRVKDVEAANRFWSTLGAEPTGLATIKLMKIPGVLLFISGPRGNAPAAALPGNHGTTVEFLTFKVKDLQASLAKWKEAGIEPMKAYKETTLLGPDDIQVRISEDRSQTPAIAADGLIMNVANAADVSAWYAKWFAAKISRTGKDTIGDIPGARIVFRETKEPIAPLRGHSLGLLGFEVADIEDFVKRYQEAGGKFDGNGTIARAQAANLAVIQLTDPWGTSIEVSQGLKAAK